jgi:hypothetical protein
VKQGRERLKERKWKKWNELYQIIVQYHEARD